MWIRNVPNTIQVITAFKNSYMLSNCNDISIAVIMYKYLAFKTGRLM